MSWTYPRTANKNSINSVNPSLNSKDISTIICDDEEDLLDSDFDEDIEDMFDMNKETNKNPYPPKPMQNEGKTYTPSYNYQTSNYNYTGSNKYEIFSTNINKPSEPQANRKEEKSNFSNNYMNSNSNYTTRPSYPTSVPNPIIPTFSKQPNLTTTASNAKLYKNHTKLWPINCLKCNDPICNEENFGVHMDRHWWSEKSCMICKINIPNQSDVERHFKGHCKETLYVCSVCKMLFMRRDHVNKHFYANHKEYNAESLSTLYFSFTIKMPEKDSGKNNSPQKQTNLSLLKDKVTDNLNSKMSSNPPGKNLEYAIKSMGSYQELEELQKSFDNITTASHPKVSSDLSNKNMNMPIVAQNTYPNLSQKMDNISGNGTNITLSWQNFSYQPVQQNNTNTINTATSTQSKNMIGESSPNLPFKPNEEAKSLGTKESGSNTVQAKTSINCKECRPPTSNLEAFFSKCEENWTQKTVCPLCGYFTYGKRSTFKEHLEGHIGQDLFLCLICKTSSSTSDQMLKHINLQHYWNLQKETNPLFETYIISTQWQLLQYCDHQK